MRYLKSSNTGVGFDEDFFKLFETRLQLIKSKIPNAHHGSICFDEMQVRTACGVNVKTMSFDGLVDYGSTITKEDSQKHIDKKQRKEKKETKTLDGAENDEFKGNLADHALVFMYSSLTASYHQPIGVFAAQTTPCEIMAKLLVTAIIAVEKHGDVVDAVVCDGAQNNRGIWKIFGIQAKPVKDENTSNNDEITCSFLNPAAENNSDRQIFVISHVPHLFKCIRNNLINHVWGKFTSIIFLRP